MLPILCPCILQIINPPLSKQITSLLSFTPLSFHRKRQGIFTSGTFEPVTISLQTTPGTWGPRLSSILILPKDTGKGRNIMIKDIHGVQYSSGTLKVMGQGGDLLFQGNKDDREDDLDVEVLKCVIGYARDNPVSEEEEESKPRFKNAVEKQVYFGKREMEMKAREKKAKERKAKFVKDAGGMKYTAIAMAKS